MTSRAASKLSRDARGPDPGAGGRQGRAGGALLGRVGGPLCDRAAPHPDHAARIAGRVAQVVKAYVSVNLLLAIAAGVLTWGFLQADSFHLAVPLAVLVAFLDLIPLIGLTVGGFAVFAVLLIDGGPGDAIVWLALFLVYQQLQDRVIQPLLYKGGALKMNPAVAIVAVIVGAELAGVLGALLAIPAAASLGVVIDELVLSGSPGTAGAQPEPSE